MYGLSPDGESLLYSEEQVLYVLNVTTKIATVLEVPGQTNDAWWVDNQNVLVSYSTENPEEMSGLGIINLGSGAFRQLLNGNSIRESVLSTPTISPDKKWIAFTAYTPGTGKFGLWLLDLE